MQKQITFTYKNITATKTSQRRASPLGIILGPRAYLVAHDEEADALRNYTLTGIENLHIIDEDNPHTAFDIDAFAHRSFAFHDGILMVRTLTFHAKAAPILEHYEFHPTQKHAFWMGAKSRSFYM